jgi:hypothetical protein
MPTRLLAGEGRANGEETDKHLFGPPERLHAYWRSAATASHAQTQDSIGLCGSQQKWLRGSSTVSNAIRAGADQNY